MLRKFCTSAIKKENNKITIPVIIIKYSIIKFIDKKKKERKKKEKRKELEDRFRATSLQENEHMQRDEGLTLGSICLSSFPFTSVHTLGACSLDDISFENSRLHESISVLLFISLYSRV
jgi:hypothetical protein